MESPSATFMFRTFDAYTWLALFLSFILLAVCVTEKLCLIDCASNCANFVLFFVRVPLFKLRSYRLGISLALVFVSVLSYNYESYVTSDLIAPLRQEIYHNLRESLENGGYKIAVPDKSSVDLYMPIASPIFKRVTGLTPNRHYLTTVPGVYKDFEGMYKPNSIQLLAKRKALIFVRQIEASHVEQFVHAENDEIRCCLIKDSFELFKTYNQFRSFLAVRAGQISVRQFEAALRNVYLGLEARTRFSRKDNSTTTVEGYNIKKTKSENVQLHGVFGVVMLYVSLIYVLSLFVFAIELRKEILRIYRVYIRAICSRKNCIKTFKCISNKVSPYKININ